MKQSHLDFAASKRTASSSQVGKAKATKPEAVGVPEEKTVATIDSDKVSEAEDPVVPEGNSSEDEGSKAATVTPKAAKIAAKTDVSATVGRVLRSTTKAKSSKKPNKTEEEAPTTKSAQPAVFRQSNAQPEDVAKKVEENTAKATSTDELPELNVKDLKWRKPYGEAKALNDYLPAIHGEDQNMVHEILRVFDNSYDYGPCVGISRLDRWNRADAMGLNPPKAVKEILMTKQGATMPEYSQTVFYGEV